jgi:hypothetical protein
MWEILFVSFTLSPALLAGQLSGNAYDTNENAMSYAVLSLENGHGISADEEGFYVFNRGEIPLDRVKLKVTPIGFEAFHIILVVRNGPSTFNFDLTSSTIALEEGNVIIKTAATEIRESLISDTAVDAISLRVETLEVTQLLERTARVRIREQLGRRAINNVMINRLSGKSIVSYFDGVSIDLLGGSISLATLPINVNDRIEIYKELITDYLGTDALDGGVNSISRRNYRNTIDAPYNFGYYKSHRVTLNFFFVRNSSFFVGFNDFSNSSDNDHRRDIENFLYEPVRLGNALKVVSKKQVEVSLFHNVHLSYLRGFQASLREKNWIDNLQYNPPYAESNNEFKYRVCLAIIPYGEVENKQAGIVQTFKYNKNGILNGRLGLFYFANVGLIGSAFEEATKHIYDWYGNLIDLENTIGAELQGPVSAFRQNWLSVAQRFTPIQHHFITLGNIFMCVKSQGNDPPSNIRNGQDLTKRPATFTRNVAGVSVDSKWLSETLSSTLFLKNYSYTNSAADVFRTTGTFLPLYETNGNVSGGGLGLNYQVNNHLFFRGSFEQAIRIPDRIEISRDYFSIVLNYLLKPERSNNYNFGGVLKKVFGSQKSLALDAYLLYDQQFDLIYLMVNSVSLVQDINKDWVNKMG